ncbi:MULTISPECIES: DUF2249 domain-containing protein [unclassified Shinella]|jgi:uncharacterized protein (DUF2249 family)|uniref:DUF2249 domain-containing protein n=1 Tax=unclassified Shinella TaxID=2643062 RepID=UPI00234F00DF|nr:MULTISPECIES: DUF2249 domain-containing protein [unclassified Shinella]MCO5153156.1 DUF2249 domain-containing protein [Shinella sp.]MDC7263563.1 DUF2249 domain-containing protein [Shinella sp. HY16]MDC7270458.1 DUF2249 domain-containing protein [Shinella sp. YZ44]
MSDVSNATAPKTLDVRPILESGGEPFQAIMEAVQSLGPGQGLRLFATFRPQPLFRVMASRGFDHEAHEIEGGDWEVLFTPQQVAAPVETSGDADRPEAWPDPSLHLDLSDLDPPEPMVRILAAAETLEPGEVLFALLSREPLFLFPELTKRGHQWAGNFDETGSAYRILVRTGRARG